MIPLIVLLGIAAGQHKRALDRSVDVQRQQYALQVAEFNFEVPHESQRHQKERVAKKLTSGEIVITE